MHIHTSTPLPQEDLVAGVSGWPFLPRVFSSFAFARVSHLTVCVLASVVKHTDTHRASFATTLLELHHHHHHHPHAHSPSEVPSSLAETRPAKKKKRQGVVHSESKRDTQNAHHYCTPHTATHAPLWVAARRSSTTPHESTVRLAGIVVCMLLVAEGSEENPNVVSTQQACRKKNAFFFFLRNRVMRETRKKESRIG